MPSKSRMDSREKILRAAAELIGEDASASLSVRSVAERAGVSTGSLRHHFPTQRALRDAVLTRVYDAVVAGDRILDTSLSPQERLVAGLAQLLAPIGTDEQAVRAARITYEKFVIAPRTEEIRSAYAAIDRAARHRIEYWLTTLADEGVITTHALERHIDFLITVLNGLALERALPTEHSTLHAEAHTLRAAVDQVLGAAATPEAEGGGRSGL